ncbi:hypothetical protein GCM10022225_80340 [Plantactinospora mayteni]|uniref:Uncharacterized protein n=1 Tax=Plantactinospora mayteni TaxID=566021 RepID=A0ABQ4F3B0_9ACTN|nr:hypothetical protein [Plantactinospora mayteni]GIH01383.1 hypothetical protein Pma05_79550 [Plantactinospora mayteni]
MLVTAAALVGGLLVGAISGSVAGRASTEPTGVAAPPPVPDGFPSGAKRHLPGVKVSVVADGWLVKANSWKCAPNPEAKPSSGGKLVTECEPSKDDLNLRVTIEHDDESHVRTVDAGCDFGPGSNYCKTFFANFADVLLADRPELRKQASEWAGKNVDADASTVIGGIWLNIKLEPHRIQAAPWL